MKRWQKERAPIILSSDEFPISTPKSGQPETNPLATKRFRRFSLKMLLMGTALLAVVFAVAGPYASDAWLKDRLKQQGVVHVGFDAQDKVYWLTLERSSDLPKILVFCDCSHLRHLDLQYEINSAIVNDGSLPELFCLDLAHSTLNDHTAAKISGIHAEILRVNDTDLTGAGLAAILDRNQFVGIDAKDSNVTPDEAEAMAKKYGVGIKSDERWHEYPRTHPTLRKTSHSP